MKHKLQHSVNHNKMWKWSCSLWLRCSQPQSPLHRLLLLFPGSSSFTDLLPGVSSFFQQQNSRFYCHCDKFNLWWIMKHQKKFYCIILFFSSTTQVPPFSYRHPLFLSGPSPSSPVPPPFSQAPQVCISTSPHLGERLIWSLPPPVGTPAALFPSMLQHVKFLQPR